MGEAILILSLVLPLLQALPSLIQTAEAAFSKGSKAGAQKKAFVLQASQAAISTAAALGAKPLQDTHTQQVLLDTIGALTDATVTGLNAAGALHDPAPQA